LARLARRLALLAYFIDVVPEIPGVAGAHAAVVEEVHVLVAGGAEQRADVAGAAVRVTLPALVANLVEA
jgi:hypothetical protein